jgi:type I restriction enzyme S subunit
MALVRPDKTKTSPRYLHYYFLSPAWRAKVDASIITGATVDRVPLTKVPSFEINIPPLPTQQRIAEVLSAYDDLIENNRRRIKLLEQAAKLLYREWFVRLRFPGHDTTPITNGLPQGWEKVSLDNLCKDVRQSLKPENVDLDTPYIGLEHIPRRSITLSDWGYASDITSSKFAYEKGDILFGKIRPYFHKVGFAMTSGITSSDAIVIRALREEWRSIVLLHTSSDEFVAIASKTVREGSKMPRADWKFLRKQPVFIPTKEILALFNKHVQPMIVQLETLGSQNKKLAEARDILLPRLMNGEVVV